MGEFSITHILLIAVIFLIFFGPSRLPQLGQSMGKAIRGFKQGLSEIDVDAKDIHDTAAAAAKPAQKTQLNTATTTQTEVTETIVPEQKKETQNS